MKKINFSVNEARAVTTLEKTLNVASAAKELDVSPNALNISISRTEQKIGCTLFMRKQKTGEVTISPGVEHVISYMKTITNAADLIEDQNKTWSSDTTAGQIILTTTQTIMEHFLAPYLVEFINKNPQLNVSFKQEEPQETDSFFTNEIFITSHRELDDGYEYFPFHAFTQRYWANKKYLERFGSPQSMEDLFHHRLLLGRDLKDPRTLFSVGGNPVNFPPNVSRSYEIQNPAMVDCLCEKGLGVMVAFEESVKLSKLKVENIFPRIKGEKVDIFVKVNREFLKTPVARYFIDWLFECRNKVLKNIGTRPAFAYKSQSA